MASDEEDIDAVALQAQIDLSLAATHNLVSSWMGKPATTQISAKQVALEAELKEYMKRPPRLGVGGSIPEAAQASAREDARLRGQIMGKRSRNDEQKSQSIVTVDDVDNDAESRASAIRKKARVDPFSLGSKKKKQQAPPIQSATPTSTVIADIAAENPADAKAVDAIKTNVENEGLRVSGIASSLSKHNVLNLDGPPATGEDEDEDDEDAGSPSTSPGKKKKRRRKKKKRQTLVNDS